MMNKRKPPSKPLAFIFLSLFLAVPLLSGCQSTPAVEDSGMPLVTVSILPQAYFAERIGGDWISIRFMVGPGEEPHTYEPTPDQMKAISSSEVFFSIGVEYESIWLPRFEQINPQMQIFDSAAGIERIPLADHSEADHNEAEEDDQDHGELDPHVWLSPENGKIIAGNMLEVLIALVPEHEADFRTNYDTLIADIDALNSAIETTLAGYEQRTFMVFHPAWGYFAQQYGLHQIAVQVGGQDPSASEMATLVTVAKQEGIKVLFIQPTFNAADAESIAQEIGGTVAIADPLAKDWLGNLNAVAEAFSAALRQ